MKRIRIVTTASVITDMEVADDHPGTIDELWGIVDGQVRQMKDTIGWDEVGDDKHRVSGAIVSGNLTINGETIYR